MIQHIRLQTDLNFIYLWDHNNNMSLTTNMCKNKTKFHVVFDQIYVRMWTLDPFHIITRIPINSCSPTDSICPTSSSFPIYTITLSTCPIDYTSPTTLSCHPSPIISTNHRTPIIAINYNPSRLY